MAVDFSKINWVAVLVLVPEFQAGVVALQAAVSVNEKAKAVGDLAVTGAKLAEAVTSKDLVNNEKFKALIGHVLEVIADAQELKPVV